MNEKKLKEIVEVLIFASDTSISIKQIQNIVEEAKPKEIEKAVEILNNEYKQTGRTFAIVSVAGGFQMVSRESYYQWIRKLFHRKIKVRLSQAALETLSVIAFKQPVSKPDVESIRGVNCDGVIHTLLERKLVTLAGRSDGQGRPLLYKTTDEFLRYFGINDINDLPKPREIEEILKEEKKPDEDANLGMKMVGEDSSKAEGMNQENLKKDIKNQGKGPAVKQNDTSEGSVNMRITNTKAEASNEKGHPESSAEGDGEASVSDASRTVEAKNAAE